MTGLSIVLLQKKTVNPSRKGETEAALLQKIRGIFPKVLLTFKNVCVMVIEIVSPIFSRRYLNLTQQVAK